MQVRKELLLRHVSEVAIHCGGRSKERLVLTLKVGEDLDHPVDHPCTKDWSDVVPFQEFFCLVFDLKLTLVLVDALTVVI